MNNKTYGRRTQGGRLIKTSRGIVSIAPALGAAAVGVMCAGSVSAQDAWPAVSDETMTELGLLGGYGWTEGVSADGSVIIGLQNANNNFRALSWINGSTEAIDLGLLPGGNSSFANAVSADGSVIVGRARVGNNDHAVSWVDGSTTAIDLGTLGGISSRTAGVSADGSVIVGTAKNVANKDHAASWVNGSTTAIDLGTLGGNLSNVYDISDDNSIIVGFAVNINGDYHAASWLDGSTTATDLGTLGGTYAYAYAVSADGSVIVGESEDADGNYRPFIYKVIVGESEDADGNYRPFIYETQMQDLSNLMLSFPTMANDTQIAVAELEYSAGRLMGTTCLADAGSACLRVDGSLSNTGATDSDNIEARSNQSLSLTYGRGLNAQTTLGGTLSITPSGSDNNGFDMGRTVGLSLWGAYSESGQLGTG